MMLHVIVTQVTVLSHMSLLHIIQLHNTKKIIKDFETNDII